MAKTYYTYRIRVENRKRVQVEKWDDRHQDLGQPSGVFRYAQMLPQMTESLEIARKNHLNDSSLTRILGEVLFDILFDDGLCQDFIGFYHQVVWEQEQLLRVELDIDERGMPEVAALPWEFLCLPERANLGTLWIGTVSHLVFSRRRSQWHPASPIQLEKDETLKIALVVSAPSDLPTVVYEPVQTELEILAQKQESRVELLPIVSAANPEEIDRILVQKPHIFHFIGHGRLSKEGDRDVGEIALVDDFDEAMWVDANYFSELFTQHRPGVVMLQACEGGMLSPSQAFVGVASSIIEQNIPVVVAMQYEVTNSTASRFARRFYQQLAANNPVDIAAQYGRRAIAFGPTLYRTRDFATPVIFTRVRDGYLFAREETKTKKEPATKKNGLNTKEKCQPQTRPICQAVDRGFNALRELMDLQEVRDAVITFRTDFQRVSEQIDLIGNYKDLHDLLHRLEYQWHSLIIRNPKQFPDDEINLVDLQVIVSETREVFERGAKAIDETRWHEATRWIESLERTTQELSQAIENLDRSGFKRAISIVNRVLATEPSRIDTILNTEAQALHLSALVKAMTCVRDTLAESQLDREKVNSFKECADALPRLESTLKRLVREHYRWQGIDAELRWMEADIEKDISTLEIFWDESEARTELLCCNQVEEQWALQLTQESQKLDRAIAAKNPAKVKSHFRNYRRHAGIRFYQVDIELKKFCGELRRTCEPLNFFIAMLS